MLGTRTKQVFSYGRRGHRVVNVYEDYDRPKAKTSATLSVSKAENDSPRSQPSTQLVEDSPISTKSSLHPDDSPIRRKRKSPITAKIGKVEVSKPKLKRRPPLGSIAPNAPNSPAVPPPLRTKRRVTKVSPLVLSSPVVSLDIVVLDSQGRRVSQEHRTCRPDVQGNTLATSPPSSKPAKLASRAKSGKDAVAVVVVSSDDEEDTPVVRPRRAVRRKARRIVVSDDELNSGSDYNPVKDSPDADTSSEEINFNAFRARRAVKRARPNVVLSPSLTPSLSPPSTPPATSPAVQESSRGHTPSTPTISHAVRAPLVPNLSLPPQIARPQSLAPFASLPEFDEAGPSRSKPRKLTPIRARTGRAIFPAPPSPPSPTTPSEVDFDLSFDFAQLDLSPRALAEVQRLEEAVTPPVPVYVRPLLAECAQTTPHEFSAFIEMFPRDPVVRMNHTAVAPKFQKIGEASYSEVFGIGDVVLKIVPLRDEERREATMDVDGPAPSDAKDVLKEIIVTKEMGQTCSGFVELLKTYVVRGKYPSLLLDLWDEYDERKGSESVRPDTFTVSQLYAIIVLPNGGPDLEAYTFSTPAKTGWSQACSIFWQVTRALSEAEQLVNFEHRDLHWGQILVNNVPTKSASRRKTRTSMDDPDRGVLVTVIDLGLARMDSVGKGVHWTPFDQETFEGEGDYQFDVYRMMRTHNGDAWEAFRPLSNVMWLHYLVLKLLQSKRLRPPTVSRKSAGAQPGAADFSERECYECLKEIEGVLAQCLVGFKTPQGTKRGRRKTQAPSAASKAGKVKAVDAAVVPWPGSAGELLDLAQTRGWVT